MSKVAGGGNGMVNNPSHWQGQVHINSILRTVMIQPYTHCCLQRRRNYSPCLDPLHLIHGTRGLVRGWNYSLNILIFPSFVLVSCSLIWPPSLLPPLIQDTIKREIVWVDVLLVVVVVVVEYFTLFVRVYVCVHIYIYMYVCIHTHTHARARARIIN